MGDWRLMALAAISEGFCPDHHTILEPQVTGGWCPYCNGARGCWWRIQDGDTVVTTYPPPVTTLHLYPYS